MPLELDLNARMKFAKDFPYSLNMCDEEENCELDIPFTLFCDLEFRGDNGMPGQSQ
jgi:hypothetical protein